MLLLANWNKCGSTWISPVELFVGGSPLLLSCSTKTLPSLIGTDVVALRRQFVRQPLAWAIPMRGGPAPISGPANREAKTIVRIAIGILTLRETSLGLFEESKI